MPEAEKPNVNASLGWWQHPQRHLPTIFSVDTLLLSSTGWHRGAGLPWYCQVELLVDSRVGVLQ